MPGVQNALIISMLAKNGDAVISGQYITRKKIGLSVC
jgi:hypothetical protein